MLKNLLLFLLFIGYSGFSQKCNLSLEGYIIDLHDNSLLNNATIKLIGNEIYTISNKNGYYKIPKLCPGEYEIEVSHLQCETKRKTITITKDKTLNFNLEHHLETLNEVILKGELYNSTEETTAKAKISEETIDEYSSLTLGDALQTVSGVSTLRTGSTISKPIINGLHSSRVLIMNNGVRQEDQQWGAEHAPNIDINTISNISIVKGSNALQYGGDAVGGIILTQSKKAPLKDTLMGKALITGISNGRGGNFSTRLIKSYTNGLNLRAQGTVRQLGDAETPDYVLSNTGVKEQNFALGVGLNKIKYGFDISYSRFNTEIGILRASHNGNAEQLQNAIESEIPNRIEPFTYDINAPRQDVVHQLLKASYFNKIKNFGRLNIQYDYQNNRRLEFDIRRGDDKNSPAVDLELQTHSVLIDFIQNHNENVELKYGLVGRYQDNFANPDTGVRRFIPDYNKYDIGAYFISSFHLNDNINLDTGVRYDFVHLDAKKFYRTSRWEERGYDEDFSDIVIDDLGTQLLTNPIYDFHNFSASLGFSYGFNAESQLLFNYSLSTRPPNPAELFSDGLHHSLARIELGDLRFDQEISNKVLLSYQLDKKRLTLSADLYYNHINGFMFLAPFGTQQTNRGFFPVWEYRQTNAAIYGLDSTIDYRITDNFSISNKSSLTIGENLSENIPIIDIPPFNTTTALHYENKKWYNLKARFTNEIFLEQTRFPDYNINIPVSSDGEFITLDTSTPPEGYSLFHLSIQNSFQIKNNQLVTTFLVDNLFNTTYRNYLNQLRFYADDLGRNIRLQIQFNF